MTADTLASKLPGTNRMKIGVVGCGALGSYYGAKLCQSGHDVHFLLRADYETVRDHGLRVLSPEGDFRVLPRCARRPEEIGPCDLVLIGLKTTANDQFAPLITPLVGDSAAILTLQNGLGAEERLAALFGPEKILGGLCFVCLNRVEAGVVAHLAHGRVMMGEFGRPAGPRAHGIASMIRETGVPCDVADNLLAAHWEKLIWNIPFNGLGVASSVGYEAFLSASLDTLKPCGPCWTTDRLLDDPSWHGLVRDLMIELIQAARACGIDLPEETTKHQISRTREMGAYRASTLLDFEKGRPLELEAIFLEPLRRARQAGATTPLLERLCAVLARLDPAARPRGAPCSTGAGG